MTTSTLPPVLEGTPVVVVRNGAFQAAAMRYERLTDTELCEAMRQQGIEDVSTVRVGKFSFFTQQAHQPAPDKPQG